MYFTIRVKSIKMFKIYLILAIYPITHALTLIDPVNRRNDFFFTSENGDQLVLAQ